MTMDDNRRAWLRGAYLDRITESAMHFAKDRTPFVNAEWLEFGDDFRYLIELSAEDHAYLREQAGLEAFRRIVTTQSAAREAAFAKFRADNTEVISPDARFAMDIGWLDLLQHAADRVRTYPSDWRVRIDGAKEKLGCCVVHVTCDYSARGCRSEVERLREEVRLRSLSMCEICGSSGRLRLSGYAKTVCDQHEPVMGDFREDDGKWSDPGKWSEERPLEDHIDHVLGFGRALIAEAQHRKRQSYDDYPPEAAETLKDLVPVRPRPTQQDVRIDPIRATDIGSRVDNDTWSKSGREQELLIEFGWHIVDSTQGACVKPEYLDGYVREEVAAWQEFAAQPLSEHDEEYLRGYLRELIDEEYERVRLKQEAEGNDD
ncbi:hypothetical protein E0H68_29195 [Rhizobium leguminosarum bv. viciae]|uniref:hypothetical protein n=1 Tax=Rhizobium leguminosarum TaxID=384 RepID=UPI00103F5BB2|nr:hypothetical protein [Rhizobium leguminosarum]TCA07750.1 hypothetical protein E0H68_29195 [Rhizobium leguminosarum bv. viciae]